MGALARPHRDAPRADDKSVVGDEYASLIHRARCLEELLTSATTVETDAKDAAQDLAEILSSGTVAALIAKGVLASSKKAACGAVRVLAAESVPQETKARVLNNVLASCRGDYSDAVTVALVLAGMLPVCMRILSQPTSTPSLVRGCRLFLRSCSGKPALEAALRDTFRDELGLRPDDETPHSSGCPDLDERRAVKASRLLSALAGRSVDFDGYATYHEPFLLKTVADTPGVFDLILRSLQKFPRCISEGMTDVVAGLSYQDFEQPMLGKGLAKLLLELLEDQIPVDGGAHCGKVMEAVVGLSANPCGQESLWEASAVEVISAVVRSAKNDRVAVQGVRAIGRLGAHPAGRAAIKELVDATSTAEQIPNSAAIGLLGELIGASPVAARAAEHAGVLKVVELAIERSTLASEATHKLSTSVCVCLSALMTHGTRSCQVHIARETKAVATVVHLLKSDAENAEGWKAIASLMLVRDAVTEAIDMHLAELLPRGLAAGGSSAYFASQALETLCTIEAGAEACSTAGVLDTLAVLLQRNPTDTANAESATDMRWLAAGWLITTCDLIGGDARARAAATCLRPMLDLFAHQPWTVPAGLRAEASSRLLYMLDTDDDDEDDTMSEEHTLAEKITHTLANTEVGRELAIDTMQAMEAASTAAEADAQAQLLCCLIPPCYHALMEEELPAVLCNALSEAKEKGDMATTLPLLQCTEEVSESDSEGPGELVAAEIIPILGKLISNESPDTAALVASVLYDVSSVVGSSSEILQTGVADELVELLQKFPHHPAAALSSAAMHEWLGHAAGRGENDVGSTFGISGVHRPLLEILQSQTDVVSLDSPEVKWAAHALGRLGDTPGGCAAIVELLQNTQDKLVVLNALCNITTTDEGRTAALTVDSTVELLGASLAPVGLQSLLAIRTIENFCDGGEACRRAVMPLLPRVAALFDESSLERDVRVSLVDAMASLAGAGASGLEALKQHGVFSALVPIARASSLAGDDASECIEPCAQILQHALTLDSTRDAASAVISEVVQLLPDADGGADFFSLSAADIRFSATFIETLGPGFGDSYDLLSASAAISVICAQGAPTKLLDILSTDDEWCLMRTSVIDKVGDAFSSIMDAPDGMAMAQDADALDVILKQVKECQGEEIRGFISLLQNFSTAEHDDYRNAMVEADVLGQLLPYLEAGPASSLGIYHMCVCVLQLFVICGNSKHCAAAVASGTVESLATWSSHQWWYDSDTSNRVHQVLGRCASDVPRISDVIQELVDMLAEGDLANLSPTLTMMEAMADGAFQAREPSVGLFDAVPPILALLQSKGHGSVWDESLSVLHRLAVVDPARVVGATDACANLVSKGVDDKEVQEWPALVLSSLASVSAEANASIRSMVSRLTEGQEHVDNNGHALVVTETLSHMCDRRDGARVAMSAGAVPKVAKLLTDTLSGDLREAALKLLIAISEHVDTARLAIRDAGLIPVVVDFLTAGIKGTADATVASEALELLLVLSESEALHLALQAASPLSALAELCEHNSTERSTALRAVANLYCEGLDVAEKAPARDRMADGQHQQQGGRNDIDDDDYSRAREILSQYHIETRVTLSITDSIKKLLFGDGPRPLRSILASVRSLSTNEALRKKLVGAGAGRSLVQVLLTEGHLRDGLTSVDLSLAADCLRRCAYTPELRPSLLAAGAREWLEKAAERGRREGDEGGLQLEQAAKSALAALRGDLDIQQGPSDLVSGSAKGDEAFAATRDDDELARLPHFNAFISHKRSDAQDFARSLHTILVSNGFSCFLDVDNLEELKDLELSVASVEVLIFVLTDNIFESYWCLQELAAAVRAGVPIVLVTKEGARWGGQSATSPFPPNSLIASLEPAECRQAFATKALSHNNEYFSSFVAKLLDKVRHVIDANSSTYPPQDGLSSGQRAAQVQRRRLLDARRNKQQLEGATPSAASTTHPPGTPTTEHNSPDRHVTYHLQDTAGASTELSEDEEYDHDEEDNPAVSVSCASSSKSHRAAKPPHDGKRRQQNLRTAVAQPKKSRPAEITQPPAEGSDTVMEAPSPAVFDEILQLRQQVQRLMEQKPDESVPVGRGSCSCVFYCCNSRVLPAPAPM